VPILLAEGQSKIVDTQLKLKPISPEPQPQSEWDANSRLCPYCGLVFASFDILITHVHIVHPGFPDPVEVPIF